MHVTVASSSGAAIEFRLLGPVDAVREEQPVQLGGRRQRALLALLLLDAGRPVSVDKLTDELWHGEPPAGADKTLRVYISRLRSTLADGSLVARPPGYALEIAAERIDATRFERLVREGRDALGREAAGIAADRLAAALALWRGPALADVADDGALALEAQRLDELHLVCREELIDAELALGRHVELVPELERLVTEHRLRERLWRQLVTALYRSERQADALAAYGRARTFLSDELGLEPSQELRQLELAVLRQEVSAAPQARTLHNLPAALTSFVGRERELADLERLLREHRLVTVTGMGGAGKTRLAVEVASRQVGVWPAGVWLVDLMPVTDPTLVPAAVGRTLGAADRPDVTALAGLVDHLRAEELLLVLDNCEHVVEACAELTHEVLPRCADVRVLATSRLALGTPGELDYVLDPLATPPEDAAADETEQFASVRLFLERARAARRDLVVDGARLTTVGRICRHVDGLPLAIELAAAQAKALSVTEIAALLADRFRFFRSWRRVADPRHQTLRATIDWSYGLLTDDERELLAGLSVFAGGFNLDAVAAVCLYGDDAVALDRVARLVGSSLVVAEERQGATRYRLLETIRDYAAERLDESRGDEGLRRAHAEYFVRLASEARWGFIDFSWEQQRQGLAQLDNERDNLHAAMEWALGAASDLALPLAVALRPYWLIRGYLRQGLDWLERALALPRREEPRVRAEGAAAAALLARLVGDFARAQRFADEAVVVARGAEHPVALATGLNVLVTLAGLGGDFGRAHTLSAESVAIARKAGSPRMESIDWYILAEAAANDGRHAEAIEAGGKALELARTIEDAEAMSLALGQLGLAAAQEGRLQDAREQLVEALGHVQILGFPGAGASCCDALALVAAGWGDLARAARLLGAADALRVASGVIVRPADEAARAAALAAIRRSLSEEVVEAELELGRRMTLDEANDEARRVSAPVA
jgi:predicted ATPase/DNA-binding SARP family transcriptional activator